MEAVSVLKGLTIQITFLAKKGSSLVSMASFSCLSSCITWFSFGFNKITVENILILFL